MTNLPKRLVPFCALVVALGSLGAATAQAQMKIGVVDIDKVFSEYYKTKSAEDKINEARDAARKEVDARWAARLPMLEALAGLERDLNSKSVPAPVRADKTKRRDDKVVEIQNLDREVEQLNYSREMQIREQASLSRAAIVEDIMKVVNERTQAVAYDLVIDKSGSGASGVKALLASRPDMEFTDEVITALNKAQPAALPEATPKPAAKKPAPAPKK